MLKNPSQNNAPTLSKAETITTAAMILALTAIMALPAFVFFFLVPLLFAATTQRLRMVIFASVCFGVISILYSLINFGTLAIGIIFIHSPWIAIIPRIGAGLVAYFVFKLFRKLIKDTNYVKKVLPFAISGGMGALANSVFVLGWIAVEYVWLGRSISMLDGVLEGITYYFGWERAFNLVDLIMIFIMPFNVPIEFAIGVGLVPPISIAYLTARKKWAKDTGLPIIETDEERKEEIEMESER
ncbi:MAG: hypothetical protein FWE22_02405 [Firmicutes bacterium]|nr:hypothetical protein [Bacillota bacterium]